MSKVSKEQKQIYNRSAYLKRKAKKPPKKNCDSDDEDDNIGVIGPTPPIPLEKSVTSGPAMEYDEMEVSAADYNKFLQWQKQQADIDSVKKKVADSDPSYLISILKTLGVALVPALISAVQRAAMKTLEQQQKEKTNPETVFQNSITPSDETGSSQWDPLSAAKF